MIIRLIITITLFGSLLLCSNLSANAFSSASTLDTGILNNEHDKLLSAISIIKNTQTGKDLMPFINELMKQKKIQLSHLKKGHYGESGEGCTVKAGKFHYEGFYILLNQNLSKVELAVSLVHEATHYRMIKELIDSESKLVVKISLLEIIAFATQHEYLTEIEQLKLADRRLIFTNKTQIISDIMTTSHQLVTQWSIASFNTLYQLLVDFGYPATELNRSLIQQTKKECAGKIN